VQQLRRGAEAELRKNVDALADMTFVHKGSASQQRAEEESRRVAWVSRLRRTAERVAKRAESGCLHLVWRVSLPQLAAFQQGSTGFSTGC
jgi:hypothetical protein